MVVKAYLLVQPIPCCKKHAFQTFSYRLRNDLHEFARTIPLSIIKAVIPITMLTIVKYTQSSPNLAIVCLHTKETALENFPERKEVSTAYDSFKTAFLPW